MAVGMFQAMLPPQVEVTYRGGNSEYTQLFAKNTSEKPIQGFVVHARWSGLDHGLASARAELRGPIAPGEERSFELRPQIDESKLLPNSSPTTIFTTDQWNEMTSWDQARALRQIAKSNEAVERLNNINLNRAFSKPPTIKVTSASGEELRAKLIDTSK